MPGCVGVHTSTRPIGRRSLRYPAVQEAVTTEPDLHVADPTTREKPRGPLASEISNAVVHLFAEYLGRGPTRVRTVIMLNLISVVLEDTLTKAERKLIDHGKEKAVVRTRRITQAMMKADLVGAVESLSGREVVAFLSDHQAEPDYAVASFVLKPEGDGAEPEPS